jgi:OmcA/MtrC family decaheme c-type cytochrome
VTIQSVTIPADLHPVVTFSMADDDGAPVSLADLDRDPRFTLAYLASTTNSLNTVYARYQCYVTQTVTGATFTYQGNPTPPALPSAVQAGLDSGGTFTMTAPGSYQYRFATALPAGYDATATHTLGGQIHRDDERWVENPIFHFVPAGGAPTLLHDVVVTATCNECHTRLEFHGGTRREVGYCVLCHTDQTIDPESGQSVEFEELIHRIHHGENLANPYYIVGNSQNVHDYSEVVFPQDSRNCTTCHKDAAQSDNWRLNPSRDACGACHDHVDWSTGAGHPAGPQSDDNACWVCHNATSPLEFDQHIPGAHTVEYHSSYNPGLMLDIIDVQNMTPGSAPRIRFTIADDAGPVDIATLDRVATTFAGATHDYTMPIDLSNRRIHGSSPVGSVMMNGVGDYWWDAAGAYVIPPGSTGTWAVGLEARTVEIMVNGEGTRFGANNPVAYVDLANGTLGGGSPVARRTVVDDAACAVCHQQVVFHGSLRTEVTYCILCHNTWAAADPTETVDFRTMIHKIHRGSDLEETYLGFNGVQFPGDLRNCELCHLPGTYELPPPSGTQAVVIHVGGVVGAEPDAIRPPATATCTSCHDSPDAVTHALLNSIITGPYDGDWSESCAVCHGPGAAFDASAAHAWDE